MTWLLGTNVLSEICKEPLAATAKVHKLALVTRNTRDVAGRERKCSIRSRRRRRARIGSDPEASADPEASDPEASRSRRRMTEMGSDPEARDPEARERKWGLTPKPDSPGWERKCSIRSRPRKRAEVGCDPEARMPAGPVAARSHL